jgi:glycyl-tRNA synthetase
MSIALYQVGGLRFWTEQEISYREYCLCVLKDAIYKTLGDINRAWTFHRVEGPVISPRSLVSTAYDENDIWTLHASLGEDSACLRAETTATSYAYARHLNIKPPVCIWQAGKSFRRETNDGASPSKLRFLEFWQAEFQCIYSASTKADYRGVVLPALSAQVEWLTGSKSRIVQSDRLPSYSESTMDIEAWCETKERFFEIASVSIRTDYHPDMRVLEIAFGLDRLVELHGWEDLRRITTHEYSTGQDERNNATRP